MPVHRRFSTGSFTGCTLLAVAACVGQSWIAPNASAVLVAHWTLEEGMGSVTSPVVGGPAAEGSLFGGASWQSQFLPPVLGGSSSAIAFDGSPNAVLTDFDGVIGSSARTIAAWVRADPLQGDFGGSVVSWGDNVTGQRSTLRFNTAEANGVLGALRFEVQGDFVVGNAVVADGQWHHVALVLPDTDPDGDAIVDLDDARFYVNGILDADFSLGFSGAGGGNPAVNTTVSAGSEVTLGNAASGVAVTNVNLAQRGLRGALDDVRLYDNALTPGEVAGLVPTMPGKFGVEINRQTGAVSFINTTTGGINVVAYTLSSESGALDAGAWVPFADGDSDWLEFDGTTSNLSEGEQPGGGGRTIAGAGPPIPLGNAWIQSPVEDVVLTVLADDGSTISLPAIYTGAVAPIGDLDFSGEVNALDWPIYRAGLFADLSALSGPQQYQMGDLNGDGVNNELDFLIFKAAFDANLGVGAFQGMTSVAVPEPATYALVLSMIAFVFFTKGYPQVLAHNVYTLARRTCLLLVVMAAIGVENASALVVWTGAGANPNDLFGDDNYNFSGSSLSAIDESVTTGLPDVLVDAPILDNVTFSSATINAAFASGFGQFRLGNGFNVTLSSTSITSTTNGGIAGEIAVPGTATFNLLNGSNLNMQFVTGAVVNVDSTSTLRLRGGGDPINSVDQPALVNLAPGAMLTLASSGEFTEQGDAIYVNGVSFATNPSILNISGTTATAVGATLPLTLQVNTTTGVIKLINQSGNAISTNFYKLTSETGSLDVSGWNSLQSNAVNPGQDLAEFPRGAGNGEGWEEAGGSNPSELGEAFLTSDSTLSIGGMIELGSAFDPMGGVQDVMLRYYDVGLNAFVDVEATYVSGGGVPGDYNGDGFVDSADYTVWRDQLGTNTPLLNENPAATTPGFVDSEDYEFWKNQFGAPASGGVQSLAAVPEPEALGLLLVIFCAVILINRPCREVPLQRIAKSGTAAVRVAAVSIVWFGVSPSEAAVTVDRAYQFGDEVDEDGSAGITVGSGDLNALPGFTLDSEGTVGNNTLVDLQVFGDPQYVNVNALSRPQSVSGALGISLSGDDYIEGERLGRPETSYSSVASDNDPVEIGGPGPGTLNYIGIEDRGFQFWARPNAAGNGVAQSLVADTQQHGVRINTAGNWEMQYAGVSYDTGTAVAFDDWSHVMLVRQSGDAGSAALLYVDGEVISAVAGGDALGDDSPLVIGANSGEMPGTADFYNGVIDDLEMFVMGVTKLPPYTNWGAFDAAADNAFIANALAAMTPGDLTGDNQVTGNGAGSPLTDDVAAFLQSWDAKYTVNNIQVGDLSSRALGDFNLDGQVDLLDWGILRSNHVNGAALNLVGLLARDSVPEPHGLVLAAALSAGLFFGFRRPRP